MTWENRITFEVSSADPDADFPVWVDFTQRVRDVVQAIEVNIGRQNDLDGVEPTQFTLVLDNSDDALTLGNLSSPYASWWGPGRKCRLRDTVGGMVFDIATGYLQTPTEGLVTQGIEHRVQLSILDRLGRLGSSAPFVSTLTEHIRYNGGTALRRYWPCLDNAKTFANLLRADGLPQIAFSSGSGISLVPTAGATTIQPQGAVPVLADDASPVLLTAATAVSGGLVTVATTNDYRVGAGFSDTVAAGQLITWVAWYRPDMPENRNFVNLITGIDNQGQVSITTTSAAGTLTLTVSGTLSASITGPTMPQQAWFPIAIRYGWDTAVIELWVGVNRYPGTLTGTPSGSNFLTCQQTVCTFYAGAFAHVQQYVGAAADFDFNAYLAQYQLAQLGMERQTTGERITTLAKYAGIRGGEMNIDPGTTVMQRARLAGQTALDGMRDAETTEQGLMFMDGSNVLQFRDRRSLYNI